MGNAAAFSAAGLSPNPSQGSATSSYQPRPPRLLTRKRAWEILHERMGIRVSRSTFYRWLENGKVVSVKLGHRLYVPASEILVIVKKCVNGERL